MSERQIVNARITQTMLGREDHGILTFMLTLDYGGGVQGFGGWALDEYNEVAKRRLGVAVSLDLLAEILSVVGIETWEQLPGKYVRADQEHVKVHGIGNILEDRWLYPEKLFALKVVK